MSERDEWGPPPAGPMRIWPRAGGPSRPDGPQRFACGPRDFEGLGREAFWGQTPDERMAALRAMTDDASRNLAASDLRYFSTASECKAFAKGWLAELQRVRST